MFAIPETTKGGEKMADKKGIISIAIACIALAVSAVALYLVFGKEKAGRIFGELKDHLMSSKQGNAPTSPGA